MAEDNPYQTPLEQADAAESPSYDADPSRGIVIEKFIAIVIVVTLLVSLVAAVPRMLM
ncbi:MAG: hypothetical protein KF708_10070 [Pirellulales bacterium]|nr:hypothetical protein [Pirellulales bacterium]